MPNEVNWLDGLFHKNDGYQTPLVINPMRTLGNIDINNENHLVKSRMISNLLRPVKNNTFNFRNITDNLEATALELTLNKTKQATVLYEILGERGKVIEEVKISNLDFNTEDILTQLNIIYDFNYHNLDKKSHKIAFDYIIYKVVAIALKYDDYSPFFSREDKKFYEHSFLKFIRKLIQDKSHITFKLKQTLQFLRFQHIELKNQRISLTELSEKINAILKRKRRRSEIIEFIPPPIFNVEIILKNKIDLDKDILFTKLSSGEKQMVYSVSSLLYHLTNLDSITKTGRRVPYKFVNIILEEIELYFHPEMQRKYISYILSSVNKIDLKRIKAISFCFVTHSPFILSDIPKSNILFLGEDGLPAASTELNTFGGNIHELLAHSFFLNNGLIGEFAQRRIQRIIDFLNDSSEQPSHNKRAIDILNEIQIIGEPFLKEKLLEMFYSKYPNQRTQERIAQLRAELARLENND